MAIHPSQMRDKYGNMRVTLDPPNPPVSVSVKRYACSVVGYGTGQNERRLYKDRLYRATAHDRLAMTDQEFVDVFTGKGSVDNIAKCLRLAARHRIYFHDGPPAGPGPGLDSTAGVQRVVTEYIGLDCTGFVGNWLRTAGVPGASPQRAPLDWLEHATLKTSLADIAEGDIVVWQNGNHIAAIESVGTLSADGLSRDARVGESSSGGVLINPYTFHLTAASESAVRNHHTFTTHFTCDSHVHGHGVRVFIAHPAGLV
jgi:hypothetical protein